MMAEHKVSQAAIERCLDHLVRLGLVRRERGRGIFIDGVEPRSNVLGIYTDGEHNPIASALFLEGVRSTVESHGFHVADFGPLNTAGGQEKAFETMVEMGFAGIIIAALSSASFFDIESNRQIAALFRRHRLPIVTCRPFPAVEADSVMPDYYSAFQLLGAKIAELSEGPILFLGHQGMPSLARMYGVKAGLGSRTEMMVELIDASKGGGAYSRLGELIAEDFKGSLILGVPPPEAGIVSCLQWKRPRTGDRLGR
jgi:DNA-binding LacI/PurR family transcriptional regulator